MEHSRTLQAEIASLLLERLNVELSSLHDQDLIETGLLDSLKIVELLVEMEQHFGVKIQLKDLEIDHFRSIASMANFVANYIGCKGMPTAMASASLNRDSRLPVGE